MKDIGLLALRVVLGGLVAAHGGQKLFGWWGGPGLRGTAGWLKSMGMRPAKAWAIGAGLAEFGGGALTAVGLASPLGPLGVIGAMAMAIAKVHPLSKPIWAVNGGAELPLTNAAIAAALALIGPGKYALDSRLGVRVPRWLILLGIVTVAASVILGARSQPDQEPAAPEQPAPTLVDDEVGSPLADDEGDALELGGSTPS